MGVVMPTSSKTQPLPPLGAALSQALRSRGQGLEGVASKLGITYNALRQDLAKNRFYPDDLEQLLLLSGITACVQDVEKAYSFTWKEAARGVRKAGREFASRLRSGKATLEEVFAEFNARMVSVRESIQSAQQVIPKFFNTLDTGNAVALFISDEFPSHWERGSATEWLEPMLRCLQRGAKILYAHPTQDSFQVAQQCGVRVLPPDVVAQEFARFRQRLDLATIQRPDLKCDNLEDSIFLVPHNCHVLCTPGHRYALYIFNHGGTTRRFATGVVPTAGATPKSSVRSMNYPLLELDEPFRAVLEMALENALQDYCTGTLTTSRQAVVRQVLASLSGL